MMSLSKYLSDAYSVGDWNGQEQPAADQLNRICHTLDERIFNVLVMGDEANYHPDIYDEIMSHVWDDWANNPRLLDLTGQQIEQYVAQCTNAYAPPPKEGYVTPGEARV